MVTDAVSVGGPGQPPELPRKLEDIILRRFVFQTFGRARRTQDSPVVPDVWLRYIRIAERLVHDHIRGESPHDAAVDLLLTPWTGTTPGYISKRLRDRLGNDRAKAAHIAQSTSRVVARIDFYTLVREIVPLTGWWQKLSKHLDEFRDAFQWLRKMEEDLPISTALAKSKVQSILYATFIEFFRYAALVGFIDRLMNADSKEGVEELRELARQLGPRTSDDEEEHEQELEESPEPSAGPAVSAVKLLLQGYEHAVNARTDLAKPTPPAERSRPGAGEPKGIFLINLNRPAAQSLFESRMTVKADAAHRVFDITTEGIAFAVIDGGIDASHPAFLKRSDPDAAKKYMNEIRAKGNRTIPNEDLELWSRVVATFDFTILRDIIACAGDPDSAPEANREKLKTLAANRETSTALEHLQVRNENARDLDWGIVRPLIRVAHNKQYEPPGSDHGTHVAGILAADLPDPDDVTRPLVGMCKGLSLYDLRVFDADGRGDEFAILCALEFVGWLNRDRANPVVHGVNLSLALAHDVDSFACGQTPICEACNHLVGTGTVVVAAAGNTGFVGFGMKASMGNGYRAISITDPGNAERVITVGSTHRRDPHAYGVSYFSARGPTGDGRRKPDILAPGEKITSTIRGGRSQRMDGTSMAAPHVSGAAALLMARYPELIGQPLRIKEILKSSATDLNREPSFQGAGLLDVLRALQSV